MENTTWYRRRTDAKTLHLASQLGIRPLYGALGPVTHRDTLPQVAAFLELELPFVLRNFFVPHFAPVNP